MADLRHRNNLSVAQRRQAAHKGMAKAKLSKTAAKSRLDEAKAVLRRTGRVVYDGRIEGSRFRGCVLIDGRRHSPGEVLSLAAAILERERTRNDELRAQHGLIPHRRSVK